MVQLIKPKKLCKGDKVATVSLSWGGAGDEDVLWRYNLGKKRIQEEFGLEVMEMPNTLKGSAYLYKHPEKRAEDLMAAFGDKEVKAIFSCIGGEESIRMLPYMDFTIIRQNPKVFLGYSDTTITHFICLKAGLSSFYGASILAEFAENVEMFAYTKHWLQKTLFEAIPLGMIEPAKEWTSERIEWLEKNKDVVKNMKKNKGYELLQGEGIVTGQLLGGCMEVLEMIKGTLLWPSLEMWQDAILFFETSEEKPDPKFVEYWLRNYGSQGILQRVKGIIWAKPYDELYYEEYKALIHKVVYEELGLKKLPVLFNLNFGHTEPMICLPFGAMAEINCQEKSFTILESGVL